MAQNPAWFITNDYLASKLNQLQLTDPAGNWTFFTLSAALEAAGLTPFEHFEQFGNAEGTSPNSYFNAPEYLQAKANQMNANLDANPLPPGATAWTATLVHQALDAAGLTTWSHFQQYGWAEGVNPSNSFDISDYLAAKAAEMGGDATPESVAAALVAAGLDPITHYYEFGSAEGVAVTPVPADEQVTPDVPGQVFTLTAGTDIITGTAGNDTFVAGVQLAPGTATNINTLNNSDILNGGAGNDTLNAVLGAAAADVVTPSLTSIENINVRAVSVGQELNLGSATGVNTVTVAQSTQDTTISGIGAIANLGVANQTADVTFKGNTATTLNLALDTVSTAAAATTTVTVDNKATTLNLDVNNSVNVTLAGTAAVKTLTIDAEGANKLTLPSAAETLTVEGSGSVNLVTAFTTLKALNASANEGGVTATVDAKAVSVTGGSGNDSITYSAAVAAAAKVDLGAGDDTLAAAGVTKGATLNGGDGTDTIAMAAAAYSAITADIAKGISNFEVLSITDALADLSVTDLSTIAGITSFQSIGVAATKSASVTNLGADTAVIMKGDLATDNGALSIALKDASGSSDAVNLTLNHTADLTGAVDVAVASTFAGLAGVETVNVNATATDTAPAATPFTANVVYTLDLGAGATALQTVNIAGNQKVAFSSDAAQIKLTTIDASANTAGVTIDAAAANTAGGATAVTIIGTAQADTVTGTNLGDTFTLGGGNDIVNYKAGGASGIGSGKFDTITDFSANTFGSGTDGAAGIGAGVQTSWTGDVLQFAYLGTGVGGIVVDVFSNGTDATTFLQTAKAGNTVVAALDSSTGNLYLDNTGDGIADYFIHLAGVTTIDAAAFNLVA